MPQQKILTTHRQLKNIMVNINRLVYGILSDSGPAIERGLVNVMVEAKTKNLLIITLLTF
jgi:thiamine phosphate synthase YjbQ (UPF0047 family)